MGAAASDHARYAIDDLVLDTGTHELRRGDKVLKLPGLSYQTLLCLVEAAPAVVTHDQLVERIWAGRVVSPETVTQRIKLLRSALGDDAANPRYIALVRGEGYRLLPDVRADVEPAPTSIASGLRLPAAWAAAAGVALVFAALAVFNAFRPEGADDDANPLYRPVRPDSVAVLAFDGSSLDPDDRYLSDGVASTLIDQLTQVDALNVIPHSSSAGLDPRELPLTDIAGRLGVEHLVEGRLVQDGDSLVIAVSIIDGISGFQDWTKSFDGSRDTLPMLQRDIASDIIERLKPGYQGTAASAGSWSLDPDAYDLMVLAREKYRDVRDEAVVDYEKLNEAIELYRRLTELTPDSAVAHARLAAAILYGGNVAAARVPVERAIALDADNAEVQYTLGLFKWMIYEEGSGEAFRRAVELNPNDPLANEAYAKYIWHQLISDEPERYYKRALTVDPQRLSRYADLGTFYGMSGRYEKAVDVSRQIARYFGENVDAMMIIARNFELIGEIDEAIGWALRAHELAPEEPDTAWMVAELYSRLGDFETARRFEPGPAFNQLYWERRYDDMIEFGEELIWEPPVSAQVWYGLSRAYSAIDEHDLAIRYLRRQDLPHRALNENRRARDEEALIVLADSLRETGQKEEARDMVTRFRPYLETMLATGGENFWWPHFYLACVDSILDDRAGALAHLERMQNTWGLPWVPMLKDAPCFQRLVEEPAYQQALANVENRKAALRARLPETLRRLRAAWSTGTAPENAIRTSESLRR